MTFKLGGNVGIGTTSPGATLDVNGNVWVRAGNTFYTDDIDHYTGGTTALTIGSANEIAIKQGKVGIGTTSPIAQLHLQDNSNGGILLFERVDNSTSGAMGTINFGSRDYDDQLASIKAIMDGSTTSSALLFSTEATGEAIAERMRITSDGNVGIGTTSPGQLLTLQNGTTTNTSGAEMRMMIANNGHFDILAVNGGAASLRYLHFKPQAVVTGAVITQEGKFGIGTTSPGKLLHVSGGDIELDNTYSLIIKNAAGGETPVIGVNSGDDVIIGNQDLDQIIFVTDNANPAMTLTRPGNVGIGITSPGGLLDIAKNARDVGVPVLRITDAETQWSTVADQQIGGAIEFYSSETSGNYPAVGAAIKMVYERIYADASALAFYTNDRSATPTEQMRIDENGKVGIGTTSPGESLEIGDGTAIPILKLSGTNTGTNPAVTAHSASSLYLYNASTTDNNFSMIDFMNGNNSVDSRITGIHASHSSRHGEIAFLVHDGSALTERMRIDKSGKVGIGTTSPSQKLEVNGNLAIVAENLIGSGLNYGSAGAAGTGLLKLYDLNTGDTELTSYNDLIITSTNGGNVGINDTTPTYKLDVNGTFRTTGNATFGGNIVPQNDNSVTLGTINNRWQDVYAVQTTVGAIFERGLQTKNIGEYETGTVVVWRNGKLIPCDKEGDVMVQGVIKNGKDEPIILGAEPILIIGKVREGDFIITSNVKGHGRSVKPKYLYVKNMVGKVIGQALESGDGKSHLVKCMIRKL
jgi:hypothetical protein